MSEDEAKETNTITLQERLERDVSFSTLAGGNVEKTISFRGLDFKATEYVEDGIPLYRSVNGFTDPKFTMTNATLQINDGSGTSTLGVSPMGGEVQINATFPKKAFESTLYTTISNNDEYYHASVGSLEDNVYFQADTSYYHRSDFTLSNDFVPTSLQVTKKRVNSDNDQKNISVKSGVYLDDEIHLAAKASLTRAEYGIPPNVYTNITDPNAIVVWDAYTRIDRKDLNSFYLYGDYDTEDLQLSIRAYYDDYEDIFKVYHAPEYRSHLPVVTYDDARLGTVFKAIKTQNDHSSTFIFQAEENEHVRRGGGWDTAEYQADTFKLSLLHLWKLNSAWQVEGGMSATLMNSKEAAEANAIQSPENKKTFDALLKATYTDEQHTVYGSIAKKSRMPAMSEMFTFFPWDNANPDLKPEKSMQYTLGYKRNFTEKTLLNLSLYYYDIKDLIIYRTKTYINREEAENYGAELRLESTYFDKHLLSASYAYTHACDSEGEALEFIPLHQLKIEDSLDITKNLKVYLGYQYIGKRYSSNSATYSDEQMKLSAYHLVDTQISYQLSNSMQSRAGIKNLFDEAYEWRYGYPSEGRSYYLSLEWKL
ncbi:TonB-dependent receptor [Sulfurovum sp. AR]|uniref:TonB-dependent receptor n=1 Tax=Sulfurovum sp. AR TaxID=1165841 RepID=UPI00025C4D94|nr:TonB-dependent receptor [Sulfurovum sp. AR]EIF50428.1 TonB-dependent receptor [Sulfurovum sp. AR]